MANAVEDPSDDLPESDEADESPIDVAPNRRRVVTDKSDLPIETLNEWITRGKLDLQPDFQRGFVWNPTKASRLIESVLLEIPIPVIYLAQEPDNTLLVVDGQQRLTSLSAFIKGHMPTGEAFKLRGLQVMHELNGLSFKDLDEGEQNALLMANLRLITIQKDSDPQVRFEVFERLNLGADKLNDMELRNCIYRGPYNKLLKELASHPTLLKIRGAKEPHKRMADRQLVLRFLAMWHSTHLKYPGSMKTFLNKNMEAHRSPPEKTLRAMREVFERSLDMAWTIFGDRAFRRFAPGVSGNPDGEWETRKMNLALWDTVMYGLSFYQKPQVVPVADAIREELLFLMVHDADFALHLQRTTDAREAVQYRADAWTSALRLIVGNRSTEPRAFSLALKESLFKNDSTCTICGQRIHTLDDSELDHVVHYWRGGQTIPENARLTHRFCNRSRGGRD